jgi:hypothetical protein
MKTKRKRDEGRREVRVCAHKTDMDISAPKPPKTTKPRAKGGYRDGYPRLCAHIPKAVQYPPKHDICGTYAPKHKPLIT